MADLAAHSSGLRRRPLLGIALAFMAGTALGLKLRPPGSLPPVIAGLALLIGLSSLALCRARPEFGGATVLRIYLAIMLASLAAVALRINPVSRRASAVTNLVSAKEARLKIQVAGDPVRYATITERPAWNIPATVLAWYDQATTCWRPGRGALLLGWRAIDFQPAPRYGDRWLIEGRFYEGSVERFWAWKTERLSTGHGYRWIAQCYNWRQRAARHLAAGIEQFPERVAVVHALMLGLRSELPAVWRERFAATGTLHVMAISGLHVGVMTGILVFALQSLGIARVHWFYFLAPLMIAYTLATGARPSAVRACIMALTYWSALPMQRRPDAPSALALAALIIMVYDPRQLATPGFQLSFVVVAGLLVFFEPLYNLLTRPLQKRKAWRISADPGWLSRETANLGQAFVGMATVSIIAWVMAAPLSMRYFGRLSLIALPANLLVVPLALLIVVTGCLTLACAPVIPSVGIVFNHANLVWTGILMRVLTWFADWPGAAPAVSFPGWLLPVWYGTLVVAGWQWRCVQRRGGVVRSTASFGIAP